MITELDYVVDEQHLEQYKKYKEYIEKEILKLTGIPKSFIEKKNKSMKKILSIFVICTISILLNSCYDYRNIDEQCNGICGSMAIKEFEYKEHSYIEFKDDGTSGMIVLHNPDCKCFQSNLTK